MPLQHRLAGLSQGHHCSNEKDPYQISLPTAWALKSPRPCGERKHGMKHTRSVRKCNFAILCYTVHQYFVMLVTVSQWRHFSDVSFFIVMVSGHNTIHQQRSSWLWRVFLRTWREWQTLIYREARCCAAAAWTCGAGDWEQLGAGLNVPVPWKIL